MWIDSEDAPKYRQEWRIRLERTNGYLRLLPCVTRVIDCLCVSGLRFEGCVDKIEGQGVRLIGPAKSKKAGIVSAVTSATGYFPPGLASNSSSFSSSSSARPQLPSTSGNAGGAGGIERMIPIDEAELLEEVHQGLLRAIDEVVHGENKWDEIMAYA